jgi:hypothetical protein
VHAIGDFLDKDGDAVDHPAEKWNDGLATLEEREVNLTRMRGEANNLQDHCRTEVDPLLRRAQAAFNRTATPADLDDLETPFTELQGELDEKKDEAGCQKSTLAPPMVAGFHRREVAEKVRGQLTNGSLMAKLAGLGAITLGWIIGALVVAFFTIKYATYEKNDTFGTFEDWLGLITAALASGVAGTILGLLAPWGAEQAED